MLDGGASFFKHWSLYIDFVTRVTFCHGYVCDLIVATRKVTLIVRPTQNVTTTNKENFASNTNRIIHSFILLLHVEFSMTFCDSQTVYSMRT